MLIFGIRAFSLIWDALIFEKFVEFLKGSTVREEAGIFLFSRPKIWLINA